MNAPVRALHPEHTTLIRDRDPWDVPVRAIRDEPPDVLQDIDSEDHVLSFMLENPGRVKSLTSAEFTGRDRPAIFTALKALVSPEDLDRLDQRLDCPGYINQLRWQPAGKVGSVKESAENLKRLSELRKLDQALSDVRRKMSSLTARAARSEIAALVFPSVARMKACASSK